MNVGAADSRNPGLLSAQWLDRYLTEIELAGYRQEIRLPFGEDWPLDLMLSWASVIVSREWGVLPILANGAHELDVNAERTKARMTIILKALRPALIGVQIANEQWLVAGSNRRRFEPKYFVPWHNELAAHAKSLVPDVPIVVGDIDGRPSPALDWYVECLSLGLAHVDIVSLHMYEKNLYELRHQYRRIRASFSDDVRFWITETDRERQWDIALEEGVSVSRCFLYSWNSEDGYARRGRG